MREIFGEAWPDWPADDYATIRQPIDFLGRNYYTRNVVKHDEASWPLKGIAGAPDPVDLHGDRLGGLSAGPHRYLVWMKRHYGDLPIYITENGSAFYDPPKAENGRIADPLRADYLRKHLDAIRAAIGQGVDVRGYYAWSLMDNLEWSLGFSKRFGIVHVNFETLERTPKTARICMRR